MRGRTELLCNVAFFFYIPAFDGNEEEEEEGVEERVRRL